MESRYKRLGDCIKLVDRRNDLNISRLLGINITKNFMPSVANVSESDLSKYKIIKRRQFAYSAMQVGRDETVRVALYTENEPSIISPAYLIFEVINEETVYPEYLMMWFQRAESDRYGWFISDSSVRASLEWERFCDIKLPIPNLKIQKDYVDIYQGLLDNKSAYERSLYDLQLICDTYIEDLARKLELKTLGDYIQQSDLRNRNLSVGLLRGVSTSKKLIVSNANVKGIDFSTYKIVLNGQFVYVSDTSRRGDKIALAMNDSLSCIVSSIYTVFEIKRKDELLSEFLYLWFQRPEFDRYARFNSWGSARETFDWDEMCRVKLPIPDLEIQRTIITIYHTLQSRKRINKQLTDMINSLCPILMKGVMDLVNKDFTECVV